MESDKQKTSHEARSPSTAEIVNILEDDSRFRTDLEIAHKEFDHVEASSSGNFSAFTTAMPSAYQSRSITPFNRPSTPVCQQLLKTASTVQPAKFTVVEERENLNNLGERIMDRQEAGEHFQRMFSQVKSWIYDGFSKTILSLIIISAPFKLMVYSFIRIFGWSNPSHSNRVKTSIRVSSCP